MEFGELITTLRRRAKLTQEQLADKVKISVQYLNQIEKGRALDSIGQDIIDKINSALQIDPIEVNKLKQNNLSKSTADIVSGNELMRMLEIERENFGRIEAMLRDIIQRQDERIKELSDQIQFLKSLLEKAN